MSNVRKTWGWLFLQEQRWSARVAREVRPREGSPRPRIPKLYLVIALGLLSAAFNDFWKKRTGNIVFVSYSNDGPARAVTLKLGGHVCFAENKLKAMVLGSSLIELDALHTLINFRGILPPRIRKYFLKILLNWVCSNGLTRSGCIFVVKEDYSPKCSLLVSLSKRLPIDIVGVQHGLFPYEYISTSECYPGLRTPVELAYDSVYANLMIKRKSPGSSVFVLGPPVERYSGPYVRLNRRTVVYVSGGEFARGGGKLRNQAQIDHLTAILQSVKLRLDRLGVNLVFRPHPLERRAKPIPEIDLHSGSKWELFGCDPRELVFMGSYSTMLYEAGYIGFRTVWLRDPFGPARDLPEIENLPNKTVIEYSQLMSDDLGALFDQPLHPVEIDPLALRLLRLVGQSFALDVATFGEAQLSKPPT